MSQIFVYQSEDVLNMCSLIVSMIGCGRDGNDRNVCMQHIKRLFLALRSFFYPSNTGSWSVSIRAQFFIIFFNSVLFNFSRISLKVEFVLVLEMSTRGIDQTN